MITPMKKRSKVSRRRAMGVTKPQPTTPITVSAATKAGTKITLTFDWPVTLDGTPAYTTDVAGATAVSAVATGPATIEVTFSASIAAATEVRIPYEEPAVRNASGGFVSTSTFQLAA